MRLEERFAALESLQQQITACQHCQHCQHCPLHQHRIKAVPGSGSLSAKILLIEDYPVLSVEHDAHWSKPALAYFDRLLSSIKLLRGDVFITSVMKCALPSLYRPHQSEIAACQSHLEQEIALLDPLLIVTLGRISAKLFFQNVTFRQIHGQAEFEAGRVYYPIFHPITALRNPHLAPILEADFRRIPHLLEMAKQGQNTTQPAKPLAQRKLF